MQREFVARRRVMLGLSLAVILATPIAAVGDFEEDLARVDNALRTNPSHVLEFALEACLTRRKFAIELYRQGQDVRAERSLASCVALLKIPEPKAEVKVVPPTPEELQAKAALALEEALVLTPDAANGLKVYRECAACHLPEGWGLQNGSVPQIAGQYPNVVIKQLADMRAGNRDNFLMLPYASVETIGGAQAVADVAAYIDTLEMSVDGGKGTVTDLVLGERLYGENCARCHGATGEGNNDAYIPRIQAQHYEYLVRQFEGIREGERRNADVEMTAQVQGFGERETRAVLDYVSRLEPPKILQAPSDWKNPDFAN
jgi:cytochrome c553